MSTNFIYNLFISSEQLKLVSIFLNVSHEFVTGKKEMLISRNKKKTFR